MMRRARPLILIALIGYPFLSGAVHAQDVDHAIVLEIGGVGEWDFGEGSRHFGGAFAVEMTPVEHVLELECGMTVLAAEDGLETSIDVLFKKPYRLSPQVEFMIGLGPEVVHLPGREDGGTFFGTEAVLDFMFWPRKNVGWYLEPSCGLLFRNGTQHGAGITAGLLIGW